MRISGDYEKLIEDTLKEELEWLEDEFELLFKHKKDFSAGEISLGAQILDNIIDNIDAKHNEELLNLLAITLNRIEQTYPDFF